MNKIQWITYNGRHIPLTPELKEKLKKKKMEQNEQNNKSNKEEDESVKKEETKNERKKEETEKKEETTTNEKNTNRSDKNETISDKEIAEYKPKHLYDVGYVPEGEALKHANKYNMYNINKTMPDGSEIGDNDEEGLKDIGGPTVSYTMSDDRYYNLSNEERTAIDKIIDNNREAEKLEIENTEIINTKSSRKEWHQHLGETGKHTHETKNGKGYYDELSRDDKLKIINNDKRIEELKQDSINQASILDKGPTYGKYPLNSDSDNKSYKKGLIKANKADSKLRNKEKSSGIIVLDNGKVLLEEHSDGRFGFPKGHVEKGEHEKKAARREVLEETNYNVRIKKGMRIPIQYTAENGETKTEVYYVGIPKGKNKNNSNTGEIKGSKFYSYDEAKEKLKDYGNLIKVLDKASGTSKQEINKIKFNTLSDYEQYFINQGYNKAKALMMAKELIKERKRK